MSDQTTVLITGASSGIGQSTARLLAGHGYRVFGTSRHPAHSQKIPQVEMVQLDVRLDESVAACVNEVLDKAGHLDVLINNAGFEIGGALEETTLEEAKGLFETNFFGMVRMVNAVLPIMRKLGHGKIINISSISGLVGVPFLGVYSASKFAMEGYTEVLRHEVKPFNIFVSLVEPGFVKTPMMNSRQAATRKIGTYDRWRDSALGVIRKSEENAPGPDLVAESLLRIIEDKSPHLHYLLGPKTRLIANQHRFLPERIFEKGVRNLFRLGKPIEISLREYTPPNDADLRS